MKEKERIENKIVAQKNNPLYDDIHQIAGDLRFIKNLIIGLFKINYFKLADDIMSLAAMCACGHRYKAKTTRSR